MRSLHITLPDEMVQALEAKVTAGEYATESDVVREGLATLLARDAEFESWYAMRS